MPRFANLAEKYRHHRKCFELAVELGCTPAEAEAVMAQIEAREKYRALCRKHGRAPLPPSLRMPSSKTEFERWEAPFMMRD